MPNPALLQIRDAVMTALATISTGAGYNLTLASGSVVAGMPARGNMPSTPCAGVMIVGYESDHASYSGPTVNATADVAVIMVANSDDDLIRLAADIQNCVTTPSGNLLLSLASVDIVHPGEWQVRNPPDEHVPAGKFWGEYRFDVDYHYDRGSA